MSFQDDDEAAEPVILENDDQDTVTPSRALPELDPTEQDHIAPDQLPTIGHVGRYALKYCIGEGGLGTVHAAHDPLLSRLIAIKTMQVDLPEQDREQFNALFLNEAKAAGSLSHPHIVTVYDAGAGSQGTYIAMELLRGKDLRQLLAVGWRPTPAQAALIIRRVADALSYAHHRGVIHRDVKPANIFMVGRTQPRILDFGIARMRQVENAVPSEEGLSRFGDLVGGSPYYMAPEQVRREPMDRRADVYSLGVVLYELLTGRKPFVGNDLDEIAHAVLTQVLLPPCELNTDVPVALSSIVMRAMSRDLVQRTRSARTLSQELREWLDGQSDHESGKQGKVQGGSDAKPRIRTSILVGAGAMGVGLLCAAGWWGWQQSSRVTAAAVAVSPAAVVLAPVAAEPASVSRVAVAKVVNKPAGSVSSVSPAPAPVAAVPMAAVPAKAAVPTGTVRFAISPWGRIFLGRKALGVTPPLTQYTLPQGRHTITVRNDDFPPYVETVEVKAGQTISISHTF